MKHVIDVYSFVANRITVILAYEKNKKSSFPYENMSIFLYILYQIYITLFLILWYKRTNDCNQDLQVLL